MIQSKITTLLQDQTIENPTHPLIQTFLQQDEGSTSARATIFLCDKTSGYSYQAISGTFAEGMKIRALPSGYIATIKSLTDDNEGSQISFNESFEISRPQIIAPYEEPATVGHQLETSIVWLAATPLLPGRQYSLESTHDQVDCTITSVKFQSRDGEEKLAAKTLSQGEVGNANISLARDIAFDPISENPHTGCFLIKDKDSGEIMGAGGINFALRRSDNITMQHVDVNKAARSDLKSQKPCVIWLTGLSGAGKSTIANILEQKLHQAGQHTYLLDGDNVRHGLNKDLGFTAEDRVENIRRISEVAKLMVDAGLIVITAFISPFRSERQLARDLLEDGEFIEVHVDTPLDVAEKRDVKGLYKKARSGQLKNFTGIDSPYEPPEHPECVVETTTMTAEQAAESLFASLKKMGKIPS